MSEDTRKDYPEDFLKLLNSVTKKRPRTVIQHILKYGHITTGDLNKIYGYDHPPRAIRDVRELGIPIKKKMVKDETGKRMADYTFGDPKDVGTESKTSGRTVFSKALKQALIDKYGAKCFIYLEDVDPDILQVDHRVPYEIGGEHAEKDIEYYMLLSPSANRMKSWTCEHCTNWQKKDKDICMRCFWAYPEDYDHVAGISEKVIMLIFSDEEIEDYQKLIKMIGEENAQKVIKRLIKEYVK